MNKQNPWLIGVRIILVMAILGLGLGAMMLLRSLKKDPEAREPRVMALNVRAVRVVAESAPTVIKGFGTAQALREVAISAEVSGRIVNVHPRSDAGELVGKDEALFEIDPQSYKLNVKNAEAEVERLAAELARLEQQHATNLRQQEIAGRSLALARKEAERLRKLTQESAVETRSRMEAAQLVANRQEGALAELDNAVLLHPIQRQSTQAMLAKANAALAEAQLQLGRTKIVAPFTGRVAARAGEAGQFVAPGQQLLTLADDSMLEFPVSLNSREVARWLELAPAADGYHWFGALSSKPVVVRWSENPDSHVWSGRLARVEGYDSQTRTLNVVVQVTPSAKPATAGAGGHGLPLVAGMFCRIEIPGRTAENVFRVPRSAVSHDQTVYLSNAGRLKTQQVTVARFAGASALISAGLAEGDIVLTSRPTKAIDGMETNVTLEPDHESSAPTSATLSLDPAPAVDSPLEPDEERAE
ncbi:efflux RND transporter periplasmic adaptor subunit [Candidatus Sumerlaeota bacterium]